MMEQRKEEITRRPLYVYDLPKDILSTLTTKDDTGTGFEQEKETSSEATAESRSENSVGSKACALCSVSFYTVEDQKSHVRSDLHGYNLKQKIRGANPVSEGEFEKLVGDLDESLSGSDSSDSEDDGVGNARKDTTLSALLKKQAAISSKETEEDGLVTDRRKRGPGNAPLLWFTTPTLPTDTYLGIYKSLFTNVELETQAAALETVYKKQLTPVKPLAKIPTDSNSGVPLPEAYKGPHIFLCMIGGGHFAAMIVSLTPRQTKSAATGPIAKEATVLAHKTFHRYTTRRKQGGAQSANDSAKGAAHSAGADLRRYNEQALTDEVRQLLSDWKGMIDSSELLFIRATGNTNRRTLFGPYDGQVLRQNDSRIRGFPFSTRRATQNELLRSFVELTRVKVHTFDPNAAAIEPITKPTVPKPTPATKPKLSEEEETALLHTSQLQTLLRRSKIPALLSYLSSNSLSPNFHFYPEAANHHAPTSLHLAASLNSPPLVSALLCKAGADPSLPNQDHKTAFELAGDRPTRDAFRVARSLLGENVHNWDEAKIPAPMTAAEAEQRTKREGAEERKREEERRKAEEERLKVEGPKAEGSERIGKAQGRGRAAVLGQVMKTAQEKREEEQRGMTPEMRMRLERERRARAAEARMRG